MQQDKVKRRTSGVPSVPLVRKPIGTIQKLLPIIDTSAIMTGHGIWGALMTEAGEMYWPGYSRVQPVKSGRDDYYVFTWCNVGIDVPVDTVVFAALYNERKGGKLIGSAPISDPGQAMHIYKGTTVTLNWRIIL